MPQLGHIGKDLASIHTNNIVMLGTKENNRQVQISIQLLLYR